MTHDEALRWVESHEFDSDDDVASALIELITAERERAARLVEQRNKTDMSDLSDLIAAIRSGAEPDAED